MDENEKKVVAVIMQTCTLVGELIQPATHIAPGSLDRVAQVITTTAMTPAGPTVITIALKLGRLDKIPENAVIVELTDEDGPLFKEWDSRYNPPQVSRIEDFTGKKVKPPYNA
jgi:hypothetical protein